MLKAYHVINKQSGIVTNVYISDSPPTENEYWPKEYSLAEIPIPEDDLPFFERMHGSPVKGEG